jgi:hypothetical protein
MSNETDFDDLYGSKYYSASDLHGEIVDSKISKIEIAELREKDGSTKRKYVAWLFGVEKPLVLNKTNANKLAATFGKDCTNWRGKQIQLYAEMTSLGKEGVRVRPLKPPRKDDPISTGRPRNDDMNEDIPFTPDH